MANKSALVFSLISDLSTIHSFYKFSLDSFITTIDRAIATTEERSSTKKRVEALSENICFQAFSSTRRGLFEKHRLLFATMLCLRVIERRGDVSQQEVSAFVRRQVSLSAKAQPEALRFMTESVWTAVCGLEAVPVFESLANEMEGEALEWKKWYHDEKAEELDLPKSCKDVTEFQKLLLLKAMRPDRLTEALTRFIGAQLGDQYIHQAPFDIFQTYEETSAKVPMFLVSFLGADPTAEIDRLGAAHDITTSNGKFVKILLGQGQGNIARKELTKAAKNGGWVVIQNLHLMPSFKKSLERQLEQIAESEDLHENFRCFITSEQPHFPNDEIVPEGILKNSIKVANEAPSDLRANMHRAYSHFTQEDIDSCSKPQEFKAILFGLCVFHSLV